MSKKMITVRSYRRRIPIASRHTYHQRKTETHQIVEQSWPYCDAKGDHCATLNLREWKYEDGSTKRAILVTDDDDMDWDYDVSIWSWETCMQVVNQLAIVTPDTFDGFRMI